MNFIRERQEDFLSLLNDADDDDYETSGTANSDNRVVGGASIASNTPQVGQPTADGRVVIRINEEDRAAIQRVCFLF